MTNVFFPNEQVKTDDILSAHAPSTDVKKKNAQHVEAKRTTTTAPRRRPKKKQSPKKSIWRKIVG